MNVWKVLEIGETRDKDAIKDAYRKKVVFVNPEEDQKGFMELRQAYEQALKWADTEEEVRTDEKMWPDTPIGNWMAKADELYQDIQLRGDVDKWKELLADDLCFSLETKTDVRDELLTYFMEHRFLPQKIWILLDEKFLLREYKDELFEKYPVNYVNRGVIGNIENEELISIEYLESRGGKEYDVYLDFCYQLNYLISCSETEEAEKIFKQLEDLNIYHPHEDICRVRYYLLREEIEQAEELSAYLMNILPQDSEVLRVRADVCYKKEEYKKAKEYYEEVLRIYPDYYNIIVTLGHTCYQLKEYENAKEYYKNAYDIHKSYYLEEDMLRCYAELEKLYEKKWKENPGDIDNAIELVRAYYQQSEFGKALNILNQLEPDEEHQLEYVHLLGCIYMFQNEYDKALPYIQQWAEGTEQLEDDGTEQRKKAIDRLPAAYQCMAQVLAGLKRYEEADEYLDKALATGNDLIDTYEDRARIYFAQKRYDDTINVCDTVLQYDVNSALGNGLKAESLFELYYYEDSLEEWNNCIRIEPNNLHYYLKKMECLYRLGEKEKILEVLTFLEENKADGDRIAMWKAIVEGEWGDKDKAVSILTELIEMAEMVRNDSEKEFLGNLYFEMARIYWNREKDLKKSEQYVDKTLETCPNLVPALNYKGYICWKTNRLEEAIKYYSKVLAEKPNHCSANGALGQVYEGLKDYENAVVYYTRQLKHAPDVYMYLYRGWSYVALSQIEKAREDYEKSIEMDSENPEGYAALALTYLYDEQEEKAVELLRKSIEKDTESEMIWVYRDLSCAYRRLGEPEKAVKVMESCLDKFNEIKDILILARIYMTMGCYEEALCQYNRYAGYGDAYRQEILDKMGECLLLLKRDNAAEKLIQDAYGKQNVDEEELHWLEMKMRLSAGKIMPLKVEIKTLIKKYLRNGEGDGKEIVLLRHEIDLRTSKKNRIKIENKQLEGVLKRMEEELKEEEYTPENKRLCKLSVLEMGKGNYEKAMEWAEQALSNHKCYFCDFCQCAEALFLKAMILEVQGRLTEALTYYEKAATVDATDFQYRMEYERVKNKF